MVKIWKQMNKRLKKIFWVFISSFFILSNPGLAAVDFDPPEYPGWAKTVGLGTKDPIGITIGIIQAFLLVLGLITVAIMIYGGFQWLFSGGNAENIKKAQSLLRNAIYGLIIILAAYGIAQYVFSVLVNATAGVPPVVPPGAP